MDLHLELDGDGPLRARCEHALRAAVRRLPSGTRLPPTRTLAAELSVSRGVVVEAYAQLAAEGYLLTKRGGGTFVAAANARFVTHGDTKPSLDVTSAPRFDLRPALPALDGAFRPAWGRALARVLRTTPDGRLGYPDPRGEPELREVLAESLARRRGVLATADEVVVTGGLGPSLPFVWRLLAARGVTRVAIEDPCWPRLTRTLARAGLYAARTPVDEHGL
jgi:GntR family transcriptional regulator/MocR family aminotransferase